MLHGFVPRTFRCRRCGVVVVYRSTAAHSDTFHNIKTFRLALSPARRLQTPFKDHQSRSDQRPSYISRSVPALGHSRALWIARYMYCGSVRFSTMPRPNRSMYLQGLRTALKGWLSHCVGVHGHKGHWTMVALCFM